MRFAGKTVVVLGGNSGIGLAAARAFQAEGARVAITGRNKQTLAQLAAASGMLAVRSDISSVADTRAAMARIAEQLHGIDVLFVNAGVGGFATVPEVTEEFWDNVHGLCGRQGRVARGGAHSGRGAAAATHPRQRGLAGPHGDGDLQARREPCTDRSGAFQPGGCGTDEAYG